MATANSAESEVMTPTGPEYQPLSNGSFSRKNERAGAAGFPQVAGVGWIAARICVSETPFCRVPSNLVRRCCNRASLRREGAGGESGEAEQMRERVARSHGVRERQWQSAG